MSQIKRERLLGAHMPATGGITNCLMGGKEIGCNAVQLFTASPRQWNQADIPLEVADDFKKMRDELGIRFTVAHDSYLINLCAPDTAVLERSRTAFVKELQRAELLGIPWLVTHMGAHLNSGEDTGLELIAESLKFALKDTEGDRVGVALETTAGQGSCLGYTFEQIARVMEIVGPDPRIGVCLDTCHIFAAGYDIRDEKTFRETIDAFDKIIGLGYLKVIHCNDAKKPLGSRVDRHEHLGDGMIGMEAFALLVNEPRLYHIPIIIETPESEKMHAVNLGRLKAVLKTSDP
jgi:deoxyribonuclease-4